MYRKLAVMMVVVAAAVVAIGYGARSAEAAAPLANAGGPYTGTAGVPVQFNGAASSGDNLSFFWNFGDNTTGVGVAPTHTYALPGTYLAILTVTDMWGASSQSVATVHIGGAAVPVVPGPNCYWTLAGWVCSAAPVVPACAGPLYWTGNVFCAGFFYTGAVVVGSTATTAQMCAWYPWFYQANWRLCQLYIN